MYAGPRIGFTSPLAFHVVHAPQRAQGDGSSSRLDVAGRSPRRIVKRPAMVQPSSLLEAGHGLGVEEQLQPRVAAPTRATAFE